jgi:low temperature requirement protein LtrA
VALYLFGHTLFGWSIAGRPPLSSVIGIVAAMALAPASAVLSPLALMTAATAILVGVAIAETPETVRSPAQ